MKPSFKGIFLLFLLNSVKRGSNDEYKCRTVEDMKTSRNFTCKVQPTTNPSNVTLSTPRPSIECPKSLLCRKNTSDTTTAGTSTAAITSTQSVATVYTTTTTEYATTATVTKQSTITAATSSELPTAKISSSTSSIVVSTSEITTPTATTTPAATTTTTATTNSIAATTYSTTTIKPAKSATTANEFEFFVQGCSSNETLTTNSSSTNEELSCTEYFENYCFSKPCQNNGNCTNDRWSYSCTCAPGFTDRNCMTQINMCEDYPCGPLASCQDFLNGYNCTCFEGFTKINGTNQCTDKTKNYQCSNDTCLSNTTCQNINIGDIQGCQCEEKKIGRLCEKDNPISLPTVRSISKNFGIMAGGGILYFTGTNLTSYSLLGALFNPADSTLEALFGYYVNDTSIPETVAIRVPRAPNVNYTKTNMSITLKYARQLDVNVSYGYQYIGNPNITDIQPKQILASAGVYLTIVGKNLNGVAQPLLDVVVVVIRTPGKESVASYVGQKCLTRKSTLLCKLPGIELPVTTNPTPTKLRRKRNAPREPVKDQSVINSFFSLFSGHVLGTNLSHNSGVGDQPSELSQRELHLHHHYRQKRYSGTLENSTENITLLLYPGLRLDAFPNYTNLTRALPDQRILLIGKGPSIEPIPQGLTYDPYSGATLQFKGNKLNVGCSIDDYNVTVGRQQCQIKNLTATLLECLPPQTQPLQSNDTFGVNCSNNPVVIVSIGSEKHLYTCLTYYNPSKIGLIVGVTVGSVVFIVLVLFIIWFICWWKNRKVKVVDSSDRDDAGPDFNWQSKNQQTGSYHRTFQDKNDASFDDILKIQHVDNLESGQNQKGFTRYQTSVNTADLSPGSVESMAGSTSNDFYYGQNSQTRLIKDQKYAQFAKASKRISFTRPNRELDKFPFASSDVQLKSYQQVFKNMNYLEDIE